MESVEKSDRSSKTYKSTRFVEFIQLNKQRPLLEEQAKSTLKIELRMDLKYSKILSLILMR